MSLKETYISRKQLIADNLNTVGVSDASVDDGLTTLANKILNASATTTTNLTINVPLNLVYGDDFNITGVLTDNNSNLLAGQTIKLLVGSTVVNTGITDSNGEVSFTRSPVSMGNHSFQLVFDGVSTGGSTYSPCESSVVSRVINKETSVLNLTSPSGSLTVYTDGYFTVAGTLKEDDGVAMANKNVVVSDGTNVLATLTTSSDGSFNGSVNIPNEGNYTLTVAYGGDTYYTGSSVSRSITVNPIDMNLALTDGSQILSYADEQQTPNSQYATVTASLVGADIVNVPVMFYVDDVLADTVNTDNLGKASFTYHGGGVGDVEVKAVCRSVVSETYEVQDCWKYFTESSASISNFQLPSGAFKLECSVVKTGNFNGVIHLWQTSNTTVGFGFLNTEDYKYDLGYYNGSSWNRQTLGTSSSGQSVSLTLTYANGVFTLSDGTNSITLNKTCENPLSKFEIEHKTGLSFSNVKIKPL